MKRSLKFRPESAAAFSEYAGGLAEVLDIPLQKSQELLALIYDYLNAHHLRAALRRPGLTRYADKDVRLDTARVESIRELLSFKKNSSENGPLLCGRKRLVERLGLFHRILEYRALRQRAARSCEVMRQLQDEVDGALLAFEMSETNDCLWVVVGDGADQVHRRARLIAFVERSRHPGSWKDYGVEEGLSRYDCPIDMLNMVKIEKGGEAARWARDVRLRATEEHSARVATLRDGMALALKPSSRNRDLSRSDELLITMVAERDVVVRSFEGSSWLLSPTILKRSTVVSTPTQHFVSDNEIFGAPLQEDPDGNDAQQRATIANVGTSVH
jgi:hypothetical protein